MKLLVSGKHRPMYDDYDVGHLVCPRSRKHIGCDSVDGSGFARFPDAMFSRYTRVACQPRLLDGAA